MSIGYIASYLSSNESVDICHVSFRDKKRGSLVFLAEYRSEQTSGKVLHCLVEVNSVKYLQKSQVDA